MRADGDTAVGANLLRYMTYKDMTVWKLNLVLDGSAVECSTSGTTACTIGFYNTPSMSGVYAGDNTAYDVSDKVDGVIIPFESDSATWYNETLYTDLLTAAKTALSTKILGSLSYAHLYGSSISTTNVNSEVTLAGNLADFIILWEYPLHLEYADMRDVTRQRGIYGLKTSTSSTYDYIAYWPTHHKDLAGWFQKWTTTGRITGTVNIGISDNGYGGGGGYFTKKVQDPITGKVFYQDDPDGTECAIGTSTTYPCPGADSTAICTVNCDGKSTKEYLTVDVGTTPSKLEVSLSQAGGFGDKTVMMGVDFTDPATWSFSSSVSDTDLFSIHSSLKALLGTMNPPPSRPTSTTRKP